MQMQFVKNFFAPAVIMMMTGVLSGCGSSGSDIIAGLSSAIAGGFDTADVNDDGLLSFAEAQTINPDLTQDQFDEIDTNGDGSLERAELLAGQGQARGQLTYTVTIQNLSNQPLGPVVAATHPETTVMWRVDGDASVGIQTVAEMGNPAPLFMALDAEVGTGTIVDLWNTGRPIARAGVTQPAFGPFAPGPDLIDNAEFEITANPNDLFSCASMIIISNDGFWGADSIGLPTSGEKTFYVFGYDAGTEENSELSSDLDDGGSILAAAPLPNDGDTPGNIGTATNPRGVIDLHPGIQGVGNLDPMIHGWPEPIAVVTIRLNSPTPIETPTRSTDSVDYEVTIENLSNQPLGPVVSATHPASAVMWRIDNDASNGIQVVAEMGNPAPLVAELTPLATDGTITELTNTGRPLTRAGVTQLAFGPFAPGADLIDNVTFNITGTPGDIFSCASMVIITNDGFWGIDGVGLPATGSKTVYAFAYDAGTEENSELSSDLDDGGSILAAAPRPNDGDTPGNIGTATNPRGVIDLHPGIQGVGNLDPMIHGWPEPIAIVTITVIP
jgi:hypothetical protein